MASVDDIASLLAAPPPQQEPPMGALAMVQAARQQLATQPSRVAPQEPPSEADAAAMMPETYVNPAVQHMLGSLASIPERALKAAANYQPGRPETYDPAPIVDAAMLPMGTGAIAGVPVRAGEAVLGAGPIRAYHGSPHDFDKFSLNKIGTGEGAQAYGHGLYFADKEAVAQQYRDQLQWKGANFDDPQVLAQNAIDRHSGDRIAAADNLQSSLDSTNRFHRGNPPAPQAAANAQTERAIALLRGKEPITGAPPTPGKMYEVQINADPEHFLDWDKPLSEQHPKVQEAYQKIFNASEPSAAKTKVQSLQEQMDALASDRDPRTNQMRGERQWMQLARERDAAWEQWNAAQSGGKAYNAISSTSGMRNSPVWQDVAPNTNRRAAAAELLQKQGIPGIKYLDQGSRAAGDGSRNYVVFDDKLIDIARKYGMGSVAALPPAALAALSQQPPPDTSQ